ncbi:hypothetical protein SAMN05421640_0923 [Ekhidna lutea]|uniref:Translation initiation factor IF-2, N-terminal region n=1 Tax=Ekhidna lutea TaxID=447679 RepID=A0A239GQR0_EKHLU|nr:hypothetical protein [Ekhidna lutea]SNS70424.1 hypothetical protein SAMN05421640_0923 [Ekhidna lutea]
MRLGQLARKHHIPVQEIISFLEEETGEKFHPNARLFDAIEDLVFEQFDLYPDNPVAEPEPPENQDDNSIEILEEGSTEPSEALTPEEDIAMADGEIEIEEETPEQQNTTEHDKIIAEDKPRPNADEVIQTDRLLELLESEELSADLEKIKLIKAPKKELSGLKVLGKVDLPEPKKKIESKENKEENSRNQRNQRRQLSEEEKEKRRLKAKRKRESFEARQEKRRKEQEAKRLKEQKARHYEQKLQKKQQLKKKQPTTESKIQDSPVVEKKKVRPEPKTWLGKWWRWMNT